MARKPNEAVAILEVHINKGVEQAAASGPLARQDNPKRRDEPFTRTTLPRRSTAVMARARRPD